MWRSTEGSGLGVGRGEKRQTPDILKAESMTDSWEMGEERGMFRPAPWFLACNTRGQKSLLPRQKRLWFGGQVEQELTLGHFKCRPSHEPV